MRIRGLLKVGIALLISFLMLDIFFGFQAALVATFLIALYAWIGEYTALMKDGAINPESLGDYEKSKLNRIQDALVHDVKRYCGSDISNLRLSVVPSDQVNATAYGLQNITFTQSALANCDEMTLCAILAHEVSHVLNMDPIFIRIIFADITVIIFALIAASFIFTASLWVLFLILALFGVCRGFLSAFLASGLSKGINGLFEIAQRMVLFLYQTVIAAVRRSFEYRADHFAVELGYGKQLAYFLQRFASDPDGIKLTFRDILYASHPASYKRLQRITTP